MIGFGMPHIPTIAIVDDDEGVRTSLSSLLRALGYHVRGYASAQDFLNDPAIEEPDCLLVDVQMPGMSGEQLQMHLVASERSFPIIFMTAFPQAGIRERVMAAGVRGFLQKPADAGQIASSLAGVLGGDG
ncbi:response regulator transcription factor [Bosea sp. RAF48]